MRCSQGVRCTRRDNGSKRSKGTGDITEENSREPTRKAMQPPPLIHTKFGAADWRAAPPGSSAATLDDPEVEQQQEGGKERREGCVGEQRKGGRCGGAAPA